ncbi:hypothetical protein C427_1172 [Paraglaciecola psychrophila 170]|uniref:Uncharacterized protein n=1 Tax=Paraglaciecola psychrophila 170 TaxID=1129794 RepID=K7A3R0_9ALTE|nr:hypothetical protein C427_1172 [Paraglaciecola psychrophila 170]GAC37007.1 hypothetical protein GPSY_1372 [Paraglaciecola psychrophila 170]
MVEIMVYALFTSGFASETIATDFYSEYDRMGSPYATRVFR